MLRRLLQATVAVAVLLSALSARAMDPRETRARAHFAAGRYQEALDAFAGLFAEKNDPLYLRNIGRCHQMMKHPDQAIDSFRLYLTRGKKLSAAERREIEGYIHEMEALKASSASTSASTQPEASPPEPKIPTVLASATPSGTEPVATRPMPPPSGAPVLITAPAAPAESERPPIYTRWWFWTGLGVLVAGGVVAALALSSRGETGDCLGQSVCFAAGGN